MFPSYFQRLNILVIVCGIVVVHVFLFMCQNESNSNEKFAQMNLCGISGSIDLIQCNEIHLFYVRSKYTDQKVFLSFQRSVRAVLILIISYPDA